MGIQQNIIKAGFGGGCHWCTEAVFAGLKGVLSVEQGFIASAPPDDCFSEAVIVTFDPDMISLEALTEIHLRTHSSGSAHKLRGKYRSAVYAFDGEQIKQAERVIEDLQDGFDQKLVTRVLPFREFRPSPPQYQRYFEKNAERPFCKTYIDPKLQLLREEFGEYAASRKLGIA